MILEAFQYSGIVKIMYNVQNTRPILEINLGSLKNNYQLALEVVGPKVNVSAVIKANAYGLGACEIFKTLKEAGCRDFYFAYFDEAYRLQDLYDANDQIYILAPQTEEELLETTAQNYTPVLNSLREIELLKRIAPRYRCVIHFNTGMNRLGINTADIDKLNLPELDVKYIMSHLACADDPKHPMNKSQLLSILEVQKKLPGSKISFSNSSGVFLGKEYHLSQIRPGCMLYGINPNPYKPSEVQTVASIYAKVVAIRELTKDEPVSYSASVIAKKGTKIATIAIGYGDGYHRILSNNADCYFKGYRLPILGRVTMDFIMVDITAIPGQYLDGLTYVEVMGKNITIDELSNKANTIGYEILTSLQNRFNRFYIS
ncbi:MAG: dadX [Candidatus Midichloriaceae bacterium]|jgi:alanine racemase|nr:dadX [Candidatus Midichloriaceae bacterium]